MLTTDDYIETMKLINRISPVKLSPPEAARNLCCAPSSSVGQKHDTGKPLFSSIDARALLHLGAVNELGSRKYSPDNWRHVPDGPRRYWDAAMRHLLQSQLEFLDPESHLPHLAHAAWNCLASLALDERNT
jgi:hypothetical protein